MLVLHNVQLQEVVGLDILVLLSVHEQVHLQELGLVLLVLTGLLGELAAGRGAGAMLPGPHGGGELGDPIETDGKLSNSVWPDLNLVLEN